MIFLLILEIILLEWICKTCRRNGQEYGTGAREDNLSITHKFTQDLAVMVSLTDNLCVFVGYLFSGLCSLYLCNVCIEANASVLVFSAHEGRVLVNLWILRIWESVSIRTYTAYYGTLYSKAMSVSICHIRTRGHKYVHCFTTLHESVMISWSFNVPAGSFMTPCFTVMWGACSTFHFPFFCFASIFLPTTPLSSCCACCWFLVPVSKTSWATPDLDTCIYMFVTFGPTKQQWSTQFENNKPASLQVLMHEYIKWQSLQATI